MGRRAAAQELDADECEEAGAGGSEEPVLEPIRYNAKKIKDSDPETERVVVGLVPFKGDYDLYLVESYRCHDIVRFERLFLKRIKDLDKRTKSSKRPVQLDMLLLDEDEAVLKPILEDLGFTSEFGYGHYRRITEPGLRNP